MRVLLTIIFIAFFQKLISQAIDSIKVDINHIFFCIDSVTYENLLKHEFVAKTFANTRELSSKTLTDSYTGKYIFGRNSYIEIFASNSYKGSSPQLGDKFGDVSIVFKTAKLGDLDKINSLISSDKKGFRLEPTQYESDGKTITLNHTLFLSDTALQETFRPYVEEKTMDFLKSTEFNEAEIRAGITEQQFREKIRGKKYEKLYDDIEKIELILTNAEFEYLAETLKYFGFSKTGHRFTNDRLEIICSIKQNRKFKLQAIHFTLLNKTEKIKIEISKNLIFKANGVRASFEFSY